MWHLRLFLWHHSSTDLFIIDPYIYSIQSCSDSSGTTYVLYFPSYDTCIPPRVFFVATGQVMLLPGPFKPEGFAVLSLFMARFYKMEIRLLLQRVRKTLGRHSGYLQSISCIETLVVRPLQSALQKFPQPGSLRASEACVCRGILPIARRGKASTV